MDRTRSYLKYLKYKRKYRDLLMKQVGGAFTSDDAKHGMEALLGMLRDDIINHSKTQPGGEISVTVDQLAQMLSELTKNSGVPEYADVDGMWNTVVKSYIYEKAEAAKGNINTLVDQDYLLVALHGSGSTILRPEVVPAGTVICYLTPLDWLGVTNDDVIDILKNESERKKLIKNPCYRFDDKCFLYRQTFYPGQLYNNLYLTGGDDCNFCAIRVAGLGQDTWHVLMDKAATNAEFPSDTITTGLDGTPTSSMKTVKQLVDEKGTGVYIFTSCRGCDCTGNTCSPIKESDVYARLLLEKLTHQINRHVFGCNPGDEPTDKSKGFCGVLRQTLPQKDTEQRHIYRSINPLSRMDIIWFTAVKKNWSPDQLMSSMQADGSAAELGISTYDDFVAKVDDNKEKFLLRFARFSRPTGNMMKHFEHVVKQVADEKNNQPFTATEEGYYARVKSFVDAHHSSAEQYRQFAATEQAKATPNQGHIDTYNAKQAEQEAEESTFKEWLKRKKILVRELRVNFLWRDILISSVEKEKFINHMLFKRARAEYVRTFDEMKRFGDYTYKGITPHIIEPLFDFRSSWKGAPDHDLSRFLADMDDKYVELDAVFPQEPDPGPGTVAGSPPPLGMMPPGSVSGSGSLPTGMSSAGSGSSTALVDLSEGERYIPETKEDYRMASPELLAALWYYWSRRR